MWMFTKRGFFSVVRDQRDRDHVMVRARLREHLERLVSMPDLADYGPFTIVETRDADYRWRVIMTKNSWRVASHFLVAEIDYTNFKGEVHDTEGRTVYERSLHEVWSVMHRLQSNDSVRRRKDGRFVEQADVVQVPGTNWMDENELLAGLPSNDEIEALWNRAPSQPSRFYTFKNYSPSGRATRKELTVVVRATREEHAWEGLKSSCKDRRRKFYRKQWELLQLSDPVVSSENQWQIVHSDLDSQSGEARS